MGKLTLHAKIEIGLMLALLLGSCGGNSFTDKQHDEIADIAADGSVDPDEFDALQKKVENLEAETANNTKNIDMAFENDKQIVDMVDNHGRRISAIEGRLGM